MARDIKHTYDPASDTVTRTTTFKRVVKRCEADTPKGMCNRPLDERGQCGNPRDHTDG